MHEHISATPLHVVSLWAKRPVLDLWTACPKGCGSLDAGPILLCRQKVGAQV